MKLNVDVVLLGLPGLLYVGQACQYALAHDRYGMALAFLAYGIANVGFILDLHGV